MHDGVRRTESYSEVMRIQIVSLFFAYETNFKPMLLLAFIVSKTRCTLGDKWHVMHLLQLSGFVPLSAMEGHEKHKTKKQRPSHHK